MKWFLISLLFLSPVCFAVQQVYIDRPLPNQPNVVVRTYYNHTGYADYFTEVYDENEPGRIIMTRIAGNMRHATLQHDLAVHWAAVYFGEPVRQVPCDCKEEPFIVYDLK